MARGRLSWCLHPSINPCVYTASLRTEVEGLPGLVAPAEVGGRGEGVVQSQQLFSPRPDQVQRESEGGAGKVLEVRFLVTAAAGKRQTSGDSLDGAATAGATPAVRPTAAAHAAHGDSPFVYAVMPTRYSALPL